MVFSVYTNISIVNTNDIVLYIDECHNIGNIAHDAWDVKLTGLLQFDIKIPL